MLTENRKYNFIGKLYLNKSSVLPPGVKPQDDKVNCLFLNTGKQQFSFVYKIENPSEANYGKPFKIKLAFTMIEIVKEIIQLNFEYEVLRGQEFVGTISLISAIE